MKAVCLSAFLLLLPGLLPGAEILFADGSLQKGEVAFREGAFHIRTEQGEGGGQGWDQVVSVRWRSKFARRVVPEGVEGDGFLLWGKATCLAGEVNIESPLFGDIHLPARAVSTVFFLPGGTAVPGRSDSRQLVLLANGDLVEGRVRTIGPDRMRIETALFGRLTLERVQVAGVFLGPGETVHEPEDESVCLFLSDGETIECEFLSLNEEEALVVPPWGGRLRLDPRLFVSLHRISNTGGLDPASSAEVTLKPYFGGEETYYRDVLPGRKPLSSGGRDYAYGLCVPSGAEINIPLEGNEKYFGTVLGLHSEWGREGNVDLRVLADGETVWQRDGVTASSTERVVVTLKGNRSVRLLVDYGEFAGFGDWVVVGEPYVVRPKDE